MSKFWFFILCITNVSLSWAQREYIDPHSMQSNAKSRLPEYQKRQIEPKLEANDILTTSEISESEIYLKRIVRLILYNAYLEEESVTGDVTGHLHIKLSGRDHAFLMNFSKSDKHQQGVFSEVNEIFEEAFKKPATDRYKEFILSLEDQIYYLIFNPTTGALAGMCLALYITYQLLRAKFTLKLIIKYFFVLGYIADFVITYLKIMQEEEIEDIVNIKKLGTAPPECDPQQMSWWKYMKTQFESTFMENPCKVYYQATYSKYQYFIAPSKILTRQFRTIIVEPFGDIGEAFGKFGRSMFTSLPWGLNVVLFPIMIVTTLAIVFMVFLFITKPRFKLSLPMFAIEMGDQERQREPIRTVRAGEQRRRVRFREIIEPVAINEVEYIDNNRVEDIALDNSNSSSESSESKVEVDVNRKETPCKNESGSANVASDKK